MTLKSILDFEFDDNTLARCDADLVRCRILTRLPILDYKSSLESSYLKDESSTQGEWGEVASTEWKKIKAMIGFEKIVILKHVEVKIVIQVMTLDLKRTREDLGSKIVKIMDQDVYIRDGYGILKGKVKMRIQTLNGIINESFRFRNSNDTEWVFVDLKNTVIFDRLNTQNKLLQTLIDYGNRLILDWGNYPVGCGYTELIRESLVTGVRIRIDKCKHWQEIQKEHSVYEAVVDIESHRVSTICWNFSWINDQSRIFHHSDAANVTQIYIKQAISYLSDILKRKVFAIKNDIQHIALAATTTPDNFDIVNQIKSNLYDVCTEINELVSAILIEITKSKRIPEEWTKDVSFLIASIQVQILPNLSQSSKSSKVPFGKVLNQVTHSVQELVLRVERLLKIQLLYLTESPYDGRLIKRSWWSGLLYETEFLVLIQIISLSVQKIISDFIDMEYVSAEFFGLIFETGFLFVLYSDLIPDINSIGIFEDLLYRLQEIRRRIKLGFHSNSHCSDIKIKVNSLYLTMSFPIPDTMHVLVMASNIEKTNVDIVPLLFIPKSDSTQTFWTENVEQKKEELCSRLCTINLTTFEFLESYLQKLKTFEISANHKGKYSLGSNVDLFLKLLKSEIQGTVTNDYFSRKELKEANLTSLANRCINDIGKSLAINYTKNEQHSLFTGIWMQDCLSKFTFHHEAIHYLEESFGIFISRNWSDN